MVGAYLARKAFRVIKDKTNYEEYGGMPLLGVNGICIIAHGASTPLAIKNALRVAAESIEQQVNPHIVEERSEEHTSELQSHSDLVCRLLLEKKKKGKARSHAYPPGSRLQK